MASPVPDAGAFIERDKKIQKLGKMMQAKQRDLDLLGRRLEIAKNRVAGGEISKGEFQRMHIEINRKRKGLRATITRYERQRLNRERALKEKQEEKEEKQKEREQRRKEKEERRLERRREKDEHGEAGDK